MATRSSILNVANQAQGAIQYLRSLDASLIWTPGRNSKDGIDWSKNALSPTAQNPGDLTLLTGSPLPIIGGAPVCEFGGTNGHVSRSGSITSSAEGAIIALVKFSSLSTDALSNQTICSAYESGISWLEMRAYDNGVAGSYPELARKVNIFHRTNYIAYADYVLSDDIWYVIVANMDASSGLRIYINGESIPVVYYDGTSDSRAWFDDVAHTCFCIGARTGAVNPLNGDLALLSIIDSSLSPAQVQHISDLIMAGD